MRKPIRNRPAKATRLDATHEPGDWSNDPDVLEVLRLLKLANAPSRYARPWRLPTLAFNTLHPCVAPGIDLEPETGLSAMNKETRRLERTLVKYQSGLHGIFGRFERLRKRDTADEVLIGAELEACNSLSEAIAKFQFRTKLRFERPPPSWYFHAHSVFKEYRFVFGRGNSTKCSPANEFVRLAVERAGFGDKSPDAVQSALYRFNSPSK